MATQLTQNEVDALIASGEWWTVPCYIGGRGDVMHLTNGRTWYIFGGCACWFKLADA